MNLIQTEEVFFVGFFLCAFFQKILIITAIKKKRGKVLIRLMQSLYVLVNFL